jgi:15-cis-phytoene synthase
MQDAFGYCAELVRAADRDRFIASLFAPAERRRALHALYAFNSEVARVRDVARAALPGEIRLQWWTEVIGGERREEAQANPVASALLTTIDRHQLERSKVVELVEARRFDLYDDPMATIADLEQYAKKTSSVLFALAVHILAGAEADAAVTPAGIAYAMAGVLRVFPFHAARGQLYVPAELIDRHGVRARDIFAGRSSPALEAALAELRNLARTHLAQAHEHRTALPREAVPALLPIALVRPALKRFERSASFAPADLSLWRRQWLIWRAARNPARIAG